MGSAIAKNEKKPRPRIKTPPDLRRFSKNHDAIRASPSEIEISTLNDNVDAIEFVDCETITNENDIRKLIEDTWRLIERRSNTKIQQSKKGSGWNSNVVRIFVSSTFVDCHSERNVLVKEVFPELRDWCAEYGLILIDVDLRWGVPAETSTSDTIQICMHELDECHAETNGKPFFLGLIGDRYGWIPKEDNLTDELKSKYDWVPNVSITHMEILHGAYRGKNSNAAFLFRETSSLSGVPAEFRAEFEEKSPLSKLQLRELKKRLKSRFNVGCFDYAPVFDVLDESSGRKLVKFKGYESFVENVKKFFKERITETFSLEKRQNNEPFDASTLRKEELFDDVGITLKQEQFVNESTSWFVGRTNELKSLHAFADGSVPPNCSKLPCEINDDSKGSHLFGKVPWTENESTPYLFVKGKSGCGKSSLLAKFISDCFKKKHSNHVFYHFIGLSNESGMEENVLKRLIIFLGVENFDSNENDRERLIQIWKEKALPKFLSSKNELIIVLDALDKLNWSPSPTHLKWLPRCFPKNVRVIVSSDADVIPTTCRLEDTGPFRLDLTALPSDYQKVFVDTYLSRFGKKLDENQMKDLLVVERTPVWLWLACEELRVFGDFRNIKNKILSLPKDLEELSWYVVDRLIREDEGKRMNVEKFLQFLTCEWIGIGENYAPLLLGSFVDRTPIPYADWNSLKVRLKPFLFFNNGIVTFKHESLRTSCKKHLLDVSPKLYLSLSAILAAFYEKFCSHDRLLFYERHPYWLIQSEQKQKAINFLFIDHRGGKLMTPHIAKQKFFQDLRCKNSVMSHGKSNAYVCTFCAGSSKSSCTICSLYGNLHDGLLCGQHNDPYMPSCIFCGKSVPSGVGGALTPTKVALCSFCDFGISGCCRMLP